MIVYSTFPQEQRQRVRTTNVMESPCAAVRLRTSAALRSTKLEHATALLCKTLLVVEQHVRRLNTPHLCITVYDGVIYRDGDGVICSPRDLRVCQEITD